MPTISGTVTDTDGAPASGYTIRFYRRDTGGYIGETTTGTGSPGAADPEWANVRVLVPGTDTLSLGVVHEATTQTISSISGQPPSVFLSYSSVVPGLGETQVKINSGWRMEVTAGGATDGYGTSFTTECFFECISLPAPVVGQQTVLDLTSLLSSNGATATLFRVTVDQNGALRLFGRAAVTDTPVVSDNGAMVPNTRYFLRIVQTTTDSTTKLYIDGTLVLTHVSTIFPPGTMQKDYSKVAVHGVGTGAYVDALRVTDGVVRTSPGIPLEPWPTDATGPATTVGTYSFTTSYTGEVNVVCLDNAAGTVENDLILRTNVT